ALGRRRFRRSARGFQLRLELFSLAGQPGEALRQFELPLAGELQLAPARIQLFAAARPRDAPALSFHAQSRNLVLRHAMLILRVGELRLRVLQQVGSLLPPRTL